MHGSSGDRFDAEFSLAIHNRTGKYFLGRDLLGNLPEMFGRTYYGWRALDAPPQGLSGRIIGRVLYLQARARASHGLSRLVPRRVPKAPLLHLDPFTVLTVALRGQDAVLCHDVGPLTHPALFDAEVCRVYRFAYAEIARVHCHLVFVSQASRDAFFELFPRARPASQRVIYPAIRSDIGTVDEQPVEGVAAPFLLTVGSIGERKNQRRAVLAFGDSGLARQGVRYVLCGGREPGYEAVVQAAASVPGVVILPYVTDVQLGWLYRHAAGFVLPSLLEGFGIPVAEAISRGLVPLVTKRSVLHEVAGDGALQVDAEDREDIAAAMQWLVAMDAPERARRQARLRQSIERFSLPKFVEDWRVALQEMTAKR